MAFRCNTSPKAVLPVCLALKIDLFFLCLCERLDDVIQYAAHLAHCTPRGCLGGHVIDCLYSSLHQLDDVGQIEDCSKFS